MPFSVGLKSWNNRSYWCWLRELEQQLLLVLVVLVLVVMPSIIVKDDLKCPNCCGPCYLLQQEFALETSFYK